MLLYHGTTEEFDTIDVSGMSNLTDLKTAKGSIRVSKFKKRYIENIIEQAKKCSIKA